MPGIRRHAPVIARVIIAIRDRPFMAFERHVVGDQLRPDEAGCVVIFFSLTGQYRRF